MADVFISYSKFDRALAEALADDLKAEGFDVWWDFQLYAGDDFHEMIRAEIAKAKAVVVIWSEKSVVSKWVRGEAQEADDDHKLISTSAPGFDARKVPINFRALHCEPVLNRARIIAALRRADVETPLLVLFSYAWLPNDAQQGAQLDLYDRLTHLIDQKPPEYETLPKIELWRDAKRLENADSGEAQIASASDQAFLLLAMMSRKYPGSDGCMTEFDKFVDAKGYNLPGKQAIIVAVNCRPDDVSWRFSARLGVWMLDDGRTLVEAMRRSEANKDHFALRIAEQIWLAARRHLNRDDAHPSTRKATRSTREPTVEQRLELFANKRAWNEFEINPSGRVQSDSEAKIWKSSTPTQDAERIDRLEATKLLARSLADALEGGLFGKFRNRHALFYLRTYDEYVPTSNFKGNLPLAQHQVEFLRKELDRCRADAPPQFVDRADAFLLENMRVSSEAPIAKDIADFSKLAPDPSPIPERDLAAIPEALGKEPVSLAFEPEALEALQVSLGPDQIPDDIAALQPGDPPISISGSARAYEIGTTLNRLVKVLDLGAKLNGTVSLARQVIMPLIQNFLDKWPLHWPL